MGAICTACNQTIENESMHIPKKCPRCGNTDRTKFIRVDEFDLSPHKIDKHNKDKKYLESRRES
jgi:Zn-ribbon containing protein (DUF2072).